MPSFQIILAGAVIVIFGLLGILLLVPAQKSKRGRIERDLPQNEEAAGKNWQEASLKLERHIQGMRKEIEDHERQEKVAARELAVQKEKYAKLQEKLVQERDWQKKEEEDIEKKVKEVVDLKAELKRYESELEKSHTDRLRFEREKREVKDALDSMTDARRTLELQVAKLQAEHEASHKEIRELKEQNSRLSEKKDAETWVSKTDYQKIETELRNKEKDLARLKEQLKKEVL